MSINRKLLFSDETENFCRPAEPHTGDQVVLRLRAAKDDSLNACVVHNGEKIPMSRVEQDDCFVYYEAFTPELTGPFAYHFEIWDEDETVFYNRLGIVECIEKEQEFCLFPDFDVPEWARGAVMYQIYTDRFRNGDPTNDVLDREFLYLEDRVACRRKHWSELPDALDVYNFYGGDLQGVWDKLDYLHSLGVEVIYFNPLFVSPSNHKYDTQDYDHIDPHLGVIVKDGGQLLPAGAESNAGAARYVQRTVSAENLEASDDFFARLVEEIHRRGMKVIMDGVFNHCGSFHKWMDREGFYRGQEGYAPGAYHNPESPYHDYFMFTDKEYESWWEHDTLPKLNYEASEELCREILRIGAKWVSPPYCVDGWRLDVAADLGHTEEYNHEFWQRFRRTVKEANPDAIILAEHYGDVMPWLNGCEWDTVMNYDAFMEPVTWFLTGMEKHSDEYKEQLYGNGQAFFDIMRSKMSRFPYASLHSAMNELDNHDHSRFLTRTNRTVGRLNTRGSEAAGYNISYGVYKEATVVQMTWPGAPTIYYGDEIGMVGWTDPDSRRPFLWGRENWELVEFHRYIIRLHKEHAALRKGSLIPLLAGYQMIAYGRFMDNDKIVVVLNNSYREREVDIPLEAMGIKQGRMIRRMETWEDGYNVGALSVPVTDGRLKFTMKPVSAVVLSL